MCEAVGAPGLDYSSLIPFGYDATFGGKERDPETQAAVEAVHVRRGATVTALRRGRNHLVCTHRLALPGGGHLMVNTAKRELRRDVDTDWMHARGMAEEHPDDQRSCV